MKEKDAEIARLKSENQRLQSALKSGGGDGGGAEWFSSSKAGPRQAEAKAMRKELSHEPHYGLIKGLEKKGVCKRRQVWFSLHVESYDTHHLQPSRRTRQSPRRPWTSIRLFSARTAQ